MQTATEQCPWCGSQISRAKFDEVTARIRKEEQTKFTERDAALRKELEVKYHLDLDRGKKQAAQAEKELGQATIKELTEKLSKLEAQEAQSKKQLKEQADKELEKKLNEQRELLERNNNLSVMKKESEFAREREKWQKKMGDLTRQLQNKTANELGDGAEIDLFEALREKFPDDRIRRVAKGEPGPDIHQEVVYKGKACGLIVFDSKNRQSWHLSFATKLHEDQLAAKADHAILSTTVFPGGKKELCIEEGVILVNPARAPQIVEILRKALIKVHVHGLSIKERKDKTEKLYQLITSEQYSQRFAEAANLTNEILDLDVEEQKTHSKVWKKRGHLTKQLQSVLSDIDAEVSSIIEGRTECAKESEFPSDEEAEALFGE